MNSYLELPAILNASFSDGMVKSEDGGAANALTIETKPRHARPRLHIVQKDVTTTLPLRTFEILQLYPVSGLLCTVRIVNLL